MAPGARSKFGAPVFESEVFRKQMYCIKVLVTLLGFFGALIVIGRPGNHAPYPRRYAPGYRAQRLASTNHSAQL